jgi:hypothetical protein
MGSVREAAVALGGTHAFPGLDGPPGVPEFSWRLRVRSAPSAEIYLLDRRLFLLQYRTSEERELSQVGVQQQGKIRWFECRQQTIAAVNRSVRKHVNHVDHVGGSGGQQHETAT